MSPLKLTAGKYKRFVAQGQYELQTRHIHVPCLNEYEGVQCKQLGFCGTRLPRHFVCFQKCLLFFFLALLESNSQPPAAKFLLAAFYFLCIADLRQNLRAERKLKIS